LEDFEMHFLKTNIQLIKIEGPILLNQGHRLCKF